MDGDLATATTVAQVTTAQAITAAPMPTTTATTSPIAGAVVTPPRPTTRRPCLTATGTAEPCGPLTPITADQIRSCDTAGTITAGEHEPNGPRSGRARPLRLQKQNSSVYRQPPAKKSSGSNANRWSAGIVLGLVGRLLCG